MPTAGVSSVLGEWRRSLAGRVAVAPEERALGGAVSGVFYIIGSITLVPMIALGDGARIDRPVLIAISCVAFVWGLVSVFLIDWDRASTLLTHFSAIAGLGVVAVTVAASGGAASPAWIYTFFVAVFAAYFYPRPVAIFYLALSIGGTALVFFYDDSASSARFISKLVIASAAYTAIGGAIMAGKTLLAAFRARAERLAAEQGALRRVATAVVEGEEEEKIYELVAREAAALLGGDAAGILRFDGESEAMVMGSWPGGKDGPYPPGTVVPVPPASDAAKARTTLAAVRLADAPPDAKIAELGYRSSIVSPVRVGGRTWGVLAVTAVESGALTVVDEGQLMEFCGLLATAIASIDDRAKLAAQAATDPLTGLANRRTLFDRLSAEVARSVRHEQTLAVAVIDIDHFKDVNDFGGHDVGDELLATVAECLAENARAEDTLGRVGGDEFAWVMPETNREQALVGVERARRLIAATISKPFRITVSGGICDTNATTDPAELVSFADAALYWSKAHGRNRCWIYDPEVINQLSAPERVERLEQSHALLGLRALARAIDAKDPATRHHSERVSILVARLARVAGWAPDRAAELSDAALVHDVGKVGVPDELLHKLGPLTPPERDQVREHAELAARIAEGVLSPEQVDWIRTHHERPDGTGYPRGLSEHEIPEGAALLSVADAWDVMTSGRPYSEPKTVEDAVSECAQLVGLQFTRSAVGALLKLHASGELDPTNRTPSRGTPLSAGE